MLFLLALLVSFDTSTEIDGYFREFKREYKQRFNRDFSSEHDFHYVMLKDSETKAYVLVTDQRILFIGKPSWDKLSLANKKELFYHELGHFFWDLPHEMGTIMQPMEFINASEFDYNKFWIKVGNAERGNCVCVEGQ